jgi:hypothetical protein
MNPTIFDPNKTRDYAMGRYVQTGCHYLVSTMGHVLVDCRHNRKTIKQLDLEIDYTTRNLTNLIK